MKCKVANGRRYMKDDKTYEAGDIVNAAKEDLKRNRSILIPIIEELEETKKQTEKVNKKSVELVKEAAEEIVKENLKEKEIKDMSKKELDDYALKKFNIKLNRTYTKENMLKQLDKELKKQKK